MSAKSNHLNSVIEVDNYELQEKLYIERIKLLYRTGNGALLGVFVVSLFLAISLWIITADKNLWWWMAVLTLVILLRGFTIAIYSRTENEHRDYQLWAIIYVIGVVLSGSLWGVAGWVFFDSDNMITVVILITFTLGISAGAATSISIFYPAFFGFIIFAIFPLSVRLFLEGKIFIPFGAAVMFYILASTLFAKQYHRAISESLRLRFENLDLINEITAEKELVEKEKQIAEQANIAKSKFLAATSHDLRQPLHALGLLVDTLESTDDLKSRAEILGHIKESVYALDDLFNSLLDISRLDAGIVEVDIEDSSLKELFELLNNEFRVLAKQNDVELKFVQTSYVVRSDTVLLGRVLRNIISNSIRYTRHGKVLVGARSIEGEIAIDVLDQGIGIPNEELNNVFSEFSQLHNPERDRTKGLGLGLAIVKRLCKLLGHSYELRSQPGKGTFFRLKVPKGSLEAIAIPSAKPAHELDDFSRYTILIIDDEKAVLESMRLILTKWGCDVLFADSIETAVELAKHIKCSIDLIISDYRLRDNTTGVEAIKRIREVLNYHVNGVLVTGDTSSDILKLTKQSGFPLLHKPVKPAQLKMAIVAIKENRPGDIGKD